MDVELLFFLSSFPDTKILNDKDVDEESKFEKKKNNVALTVR